MSATAPPFEFPVLVGDIGGTNARFAVIPDADSAMERIPNLATADFDTIVDAVSGIIERRNIELDETTEQNFKAFYGKEDADGGSGPGGERDDGRNHPGGMC